MELYLSIRYAHFLGIFLVVGALVAELVLVKKELTRSELNRISKIDGLYGFGSILTLGAGFLMWFAVGKPAEFYSYNWIFYTKIFLFLLVGVLSIWPTVFFFKNRKGPDVPTKLPAYIPMLIQVEVALIAIIPLLAILMAQGIGSVS